MTWVKPNYHFATIREHLITKIKYGKVVRKRTMPFFTTG